MLRGGLSHAHPGQNTAPVPPGETHRPPMTHLVGSMGSHRTTTLWSQGSAQHLQQLPALSMSEKLVLQVGTQRGQGSSPPTSCEQCVKMQVA